jgi:uncharacterized protein YcfL
MKKLILILGFLALAGCSAAQQDQANQQLQQAAVIGQEIAACTATQALSTAAAWEAAQNPPKTPTGVQLAAWSEQAAAQCALRYMPVAQAAPAK